MLVGMFWWWMADGWVGNGIGCSRDVLKAMLSAKDQELMS